MKARSKHAQLQRYTRNWATHEIMKTLIKNKRSYKKRIASEDDVRDSVMKDEGELDGDDDEEWNGDEEENGANYEGEWNSDDVEGNAEEEEDMYVEERVNAEEGSPSVQGNGDKELSVDVDDSAVGRRKGLCGGDLELEAAAGLGATTSHSVTAKKAKKAKKPAVVSKSVSKFKPVTVGLVGTKRKAPEDEDGYHDQAAATERRNPARNIRKSKKLQL